MKLYEKRNKEYNEMQERREKEKLEIQELLIKELSCENIEVLSIKEREDSEFYYAVTLDFTLDGYKQTDDFLWHGNKSLEEFVEKIKGDISYIKKLREQYYDFCKQNDFIQSNSNYKKKLNLTHMGYERNFYLDIQLADYLKLPNSTSYSVGGGDYEIKRTPRRVEEYNKNIDVTIDFLIDCISDLKKMKYQPGIEVVK